MKEISFRNDILPLKDKLYRLALRIVFDAAEAEDVVQDTLVRVWDKRGEWPQIDSMEAFCTIICRNMAIDRSAKKARQNVTLNEELHAQADETENPHAALASRERLNIVQQLFDELPEQQRSVMQLREIEGKNYKEIAEMLCLSEEQVKVNLFRARQKIRQRYKEIENYGL